MDFHLLQSFETGRELRLAIGYGPIQSRTDRAGNRTLCGTPGVIGDAANRVNLGLGERSSPIPERRSPELRRMLSMPLPYRWVDQPLTAVNGLILVRHPL